MWHLEHGKDWRGSFCHVWGTNPYHEHTHYPSGYLTGELPPNYPMPAIRECPLCGSKHIGHSHWMTDDGLIIPE